MNLKKKNSIEKKEKNPGQQEDSSTASAASLAQPGQPCAMLTLAPDPQPHPEGGRCRFPVSTWAGPGRAPVSAHPLLSGALWTKRPGRLLFPSPARPPARLWTTCFSVPPLCSASSEPRFLGDFPGPHPGLCHGFFGLQPCPLTPVESPHHLLPAALLCSHPAASPPDLYQVWKQSGEAAII